MSAFPNDYQPTQNSLIGALQRNGPGLYTFRRGEGAGVHLFAGRPPPPYELYLEEIDELFGTIWLAMRVNPEFFTTSLDENARAYLTQANKAAPFGKAD